MIRQTLNAAADLGRQTAESIARHPRRLMGSLGVLLLGTGVTAFGIAPLAPDAADLPVHQVVEALPASAQPTLIASPLIPLGLEQGNPLLADTKPWTLYRSDTTRSDDTPQSLLKRLGVNDTEAQTFLGRDPLARQLLASRQTRLVHAEASPSQELERLTARWVDPRDDRGFLRLVVERAPDGLSARLEKGRLEASPRLVSGEINSSLFAATDAANIPDAVAVQLAEMFASDIDFRRDLRKGDRFHVVYEALVADGEPLKTGRILAADFINNGRTHEAVWFEAPGVKGGYYGFDGESKRRFYLSSPLEFSRVSSGYGMRFHPVLGTQRAHLGVDFAAPTGTPVRTVGDGLVEFAGVQRGYGNVIFVRHRNNQVTVYAHLSRIGVRTGQRVAQGEFIGNVGSTGMSTGPHLHFEFRDNGVHRDPLVIARESEAIKLPENLRGSFAAVAQAQRSKLEAAAQVRQASAD
ncbi:M23 family metallopeptidase [Hydrogenophaga crocea]|nr:M23 family metallopeptidase [Hydrogenophaga crocea]